MANSMGLEALAEAAKLIASQIKKAVGETSPTGPIAEEGKGPDSVPIVAPEQKPPIYTLGQAVKQAIEEVVVEYPLLARVINTHRKGLEYAIYEQLKGSTGPTRVA